MAYRAAFAVAASCDNPLDMSGAAMRPIPERHPLKGDRARLDAISEKMWWAILKVLGHPRQRRPRPGRPGEPEIILLGGTSARDVLQEALIDLLQSPYGPDINWEGLGVKIAQNRAKDALRSSRAGRRRRNADDTEVASLDLENPRGERLVDELPDPLDVELTLDEAEEEVQRLERQQALHEIAREVLTDRDRQILFRIQRGETRVEIAEDFGVTPQRIGQIYAKALTVLPNHLNGHPLFPTPTTDPTEGGNPHDD
jgi:RNA polymerase sigma factor (sigma-70 family)